MSSYTLEILEQAYKSQYPDLAAETIKIMAQRLHSQLNTMDIAWRRSNYRFYRNNELQDFQTCCPSACILRYSGSS